MKAIVIEKQGENEPLKLSLHEKAPEPQDNQVLVKMAYSGINFVDIYQQNGLYKVSVPEIAGREGSGTVTKVGKDLLDKFKTGDRVSVFTQGTMAEYTAAGSREIMKLPDTLSLKKGAALMLQGLTAWTLCKDAYEVKKGDWIFIQACAGGTGLLLLQICKHLGARVIGTVSTEEKAGLARDHGIDYLIVGKDQNFVEEVMRITGGLGCEAVFSGIGKDTFDQDMCCVRRKGTMVTFGNTTGAVPPISPLKLSAKNIKLVRPTLANYIATDDELLTRSTELIDLVVQKGLRLTISKVYEFTDVENACKDLVGRKTFGKVLLKI